ncbi:MAG: hypothetical protein K2G38_01880, partial [Clostridia bacterium]|nr:hypothetical protein [Clostridia bacterium]
RRPMFVTEEGALPVRPIKPLSPHLAIKNSKLELMYFGGSKYAKLLSSSAPKKLIFEYNVSSFRGKEYIKGFVRDVVYGNDARAYAEEEMALSLVETLSNEKSDCNVLAIAKAEVENLIKNKAAGTVFISWDNTAINSYENCGNLGIDLFVPSSRSFHTSILVAPTQEADLSGYKRVILLDNPECASRLNVACVEVVESAPSSRVINKLNCEREELLTVFAQISANASNLDGSCAEEVAKRNNLGNKLQVFFAMKVFEQLELITFKNGRLEVVRGVKSKLENSPLYNMVKEIKEEHFGRY